MSRWVVLVLLFAACSERHVERISRTATAPAAAPPPLVAASSNPTASADTPPSPPSLESEATVVLSVPVRAQARESPPAGWCGETAVQEGLLHLGVWAPQRVVNKAGSPAHPDLYATEIPAALTALGVKYTFYAPPQRGYAPFAKWIATALDAGDPVLAGAKILPTQHPEWGLDHFVLVVGYGTKGLLASTTWGTREWIADTTTPGLSFKNAFYAIRLTGRALTKGALPARLDVTGEDVTGVKLAVSCATDARATMRIEQRTDNADGKLAWSADVNAGTPAIARTVGADHAEYFQCLPR